MGVKYGVVAWRYGRERYLGPLFNTETGELARRAPVCFSNGDRGKLFITPNFMRELDQIECELSESHETKPEMVLVR